MAEVQTQLATMSLDAKPEDCRRVNMEMPPTSIAIPPHSQVTAAKLNTYSPVNQNGSFEFDRVLKSGYVQKRARKTKTWRTIYIVLRPNTLSIYKSDKEEKLRHKLHLSDLTAVAMLKDPKNKRQNVFGLFSPSKNYHLQASSQQDAQEWIDLIRQGARIEEEEEEMFLASPAVRQASFFIANSPTANVGGADAPPRPSAVITLDRLASSSPEPLEPPRTFGRSGVRRPSMLESSGMSGTELASHSDFSDCDVQRHHGASFESLTFHSPPNMVASPPTNNAATSGAGVPNASTSQVSGINNLEPDRVIWQGWMWFLRSKGGVRQWKKSWAVLRPRNFKLHKDESESSVLFIAYLSSIVNVVDIDPMSRTKKHCLQLITDEKSYKFCAQGEEELVQCLGAFKSLLAKRKELEAKVANANATTAAVATVPITTASNA
ncbi:hypothetical protein QBC38DRAFT_239164 [Podospora fimiseda]|uniref:PH domain-containing protein n=1 Tax=Podospora fimiseda TaxID=252190 RepID=A0AAN7H0I2_9PEZI|nr:hypothetical protein QBC38DRAFT_239164 [Podospora fimiseda]